jgi:hypothetical protein
MSQNPNVTVTLRGDDDDSVRRAATFVAQLLREGVRADVTEDVVRHVSGLSGAPGYVVNLWGY